MTLRRSGCEICPVREIVLGEMTHRDTILLGYRRPSSLSRAQTYGSVFDAMWTSLCA